MLDIVMETAFSATVCEMAWRQLGVGIANWAAFATGPHANLGLVARPLTSAIWFRSLLLTPPQRGCSALVDAFVHELEKHRERLPKPPMAHG